MAVYHHLTLAGCDLNLANLIAKNGSWNLPFSASNCDIRCYIWLYFCLASGLSPLDRGFYHICNHQSVDCGGSIPPSEFWSWNSSTLTLDGLYCPLRMIERHVGVHPLCLATSAMLLICLVNCFTFSLANFPPFRVWHVHGSFSSLASCRSILVCVQLAFVSLTTPLM